MENVTLKLDEKGNGDFSIRENEQETGKMVIHIGNKSLIVYHTEVSPEAEGKGLAKKLLDAMVSYAREHQLKVNPLCAYVHAQFKRHPQDYADVWNNS